MPKQYIVTILILVFSISILINTANAQDVEKYMAPQRLIDCPTAGIAEEERAYFYLRLYHQGGLLAMANTGITRTFTLGLSASGIGVIGSDDIEARIGIQLKYMMLSENEGGTGVPAISIGLNTQGYGPFSEVHNRYQFKSKGLYVVASKNYRLDPGVYLSNLGIHGGINYSFENDDETNGADVFLGLDKILIEPVLEFIVEYDLGLNDDLEDGDFGEPENQGYLNMGLRWSPFRTLNLEFIMKNVNENNGDPIRIFTLTFRTDFKLRIE